MGWGDHEELVMEDNVKQRKPSKVFPLILVALVLTVLTLVVVLSYFIVQYKALNSICTSEQCVQSAATYLSNMDRSVDPCINFYQYACGGWESRHVIPDDKTSVSSFDNLDEDVLVKCKALFERAPGTKEAKSITNVRNYYKSCMDLDSINSLGAKPLIDILTDVGGWPVLGSKLGGNWVESSYRFEDLRTLMAKKYGAGGIISAYISVDDKNSSSNVLMIDQPGLNLGNRDFYLEANYTKRREAFKKYMVDVAVALGADMSDAQEQMQDVLDFEIAIANITVPSTERRDSEKLYNVFTLQELGTTYTQINWALLFNQQLDEKVTPLPDNERIINSSPDFIKNMTELLPRQSKRVVVNYLIWNLVSSYVSLLGQDFLDIQQTFFSTLYGTSKGSSRWKRCISDVKEGTLAFATGRMYVTENFAGNSKEKTAQMVNNLKDAFKGMLSTNDWMAEEDKKVAAEKADTMKVYVGYPDWIVNDTALDEHYEGLADLGADKFFENNILYLQRSLKKNMASLREPVDKERWGMAPAVVNAYYSPSQNKIVFPAAILQPPFYHHDLPWYSNYGGIGVVIGHEITHGFDDEGRQYDKDGNLKAWWSENSVNKFKDRAQCIVDQYSAFKMPETGEHLRGKQVQGENIADNGGLKESFKAFKDNSSPQPPLPGIDLTEEQMFFLSFAQVWCTLARPEAISHQLLSDPHSPGRYRVIGPPQNNKDFAKAFNCPADSYMNPANKCDVW